jgi:hypothetical protein
MVNNNNIQQLINDFTNRTKFYRGDVNEAVIECLKELQEYRSDDSVVPDQVVSDGGSTSYYGIPEWASELRHLMEHKKMTPDQANIFKASYRLGEKSGTSMEYDLNKIIFFANCIKERIARERSNDAITQHKSEL